MPSLLVFSVLGFFFPILAQQTAIGKEFRNFHKMGHEEFIDIRINSLRKKETQEYLNELIDAGICIFIHETDPTPEMIKKYYEDAIRERLFFSLHRGMSYEFILKIFAENLMLHNLLSRLAAGIGGENGPNPDEFDGQEVKHAENLVLPSAPDFKEVDALPEEISTNPFNDTSKCPFSGIETVKLDLSPPPPPMKEQLKEPTLYECVKVSSWKCPHCTFHNENNSSQCDACTLDKDLLVGTLNGMTYSIISAPLSQYTLGAVSACTNMSFQALSDCLHSLHGSTAPFGCTFSVLNNILASGSTYVGKSHQDLEDVILCRPDLMDRLYRVCLCLSISLMLLQFPGMIDIDPRKPYNGLKRGELFMTEVKSPIGCVITCQAQSLAVIYAYPTNKFILFDSHSRQHNQCSFGACLLFFDSLVDVASYLENLFPPIDQPDISRQSLQEQLQYAHLAVGQGDFFCLKANAPLPLRQEQISLPEQKNDITHLPFPPDPRVQYLQHDNSLLRERVEVLERKMLDMNRDMEHRISIENKLRLETQQELALVREWVTSKIQLQADIIEHLRLELKLVKNEHSHSRERSIRDAEAKRSQSPWYIVHDSDTEPKVSSATQAQETLQKDIEFAMLLEQEEKARVDEEERLEKIRLQKLEEIYEADSLLARQSYFYCCICRNDEVHIEDKFDLEHQNHCICRDCARSYMEAKISDRNFPIKCLFEDCDYILPDTKCFEVLPEDHQEIYLELSSRPNADPQFRQCPVPNCSGFDLPDPNSNDCVCAKCSHHWCCQCQVDLETSQHQGITCERYQQWKKENDQGDEAMERFLRNGLSDRDGDDRMRRCPNCKTAYMKDKNCNHVVCTGGCQVHFCFRCANFHANNADAIYNHQSSCSGYNET